jgi:hypothetical protein
MRDEAPAATRGGINERERPPRNSLGRRAGRMVLASGPASFVAAEIHLGRRSAGFSDELTALQHTSCVPARMLENIFIFQCSSEHVESFEAGFSAARGHHA